MPSWLYTNSSVLNANLVCFETENHLIGCCTQVPVKQQILKHQNGISVFLNIEYFIELSKEHAANNV